MDEPQNLISKVFKTINKIYVRFRVIYITYILLVNSVRIDHADTNDNGFLEKQTDIGCCQ